MSPRRRRFSVATLASLTAVAALTTGCATFTGNKHAASVNGEHLAITDFEAMLVDAPNLGLQDSDTSGEYSGDTARALLGVWVSATAISTGLAERGLTISDDDRAVAQARYSSSDPATWEKLSVPTKELLINFTAARTALANDPSLASAARTLYEDGVTGSGVLCLRIMAFDTEDEATAALEQVRNGTDFAAIAEDHPVDPSAPANGGIFTDQSTGAECLDASGYQPLAQALLDVPVGESSEVTTLGSTFFFLILQRPYDEVADQLASLLGTAGAQALAESITSAADVSIDSRYGQWDAESGEVVAVR
ncbi:MAG TPA: hypothetical protein PLV68_06075 [Ilumatobacteraceae bacterium]|nr:hypothetical protein [Ilumatobacteraceae bacterium]